MTNQTKKIPGLNLFSIRISETLINSIRWLIALCLIIFMGGLIKSYFIHNFEPIKEALMALGGLTMCFVVWWILFPHLRRKKSGKVRSKIREFDDQNIIHLDTSQIPNDKYETICPIYKLQNRS